MKLIRVFIFLAIGIGCATVVTATPSTIVRTVEPLSASEILTRQPLPTYTLATKPCISKSN